MWTTPDICDEYADQLEIVEPIFQDLGGNRKFSGEIVTVKCFEDNSLVKEQVNLEGMGRVLVVDGGGSRRCALLGDRLAESAVKNGWSGLLLYGCIRDVEIIREMSLGVKALGVIPIKSVRKGRGDLNLPVRFAGVCFRPGSYLYADDNGVIVAESQVV